MAFVDMLFNLLGSARPTDPYQVVEIKSTVLATRRVLERSESIILYEGAEPGTFELVLHQTVHVNMHSAYSLLRTDSRELARQYFTTLRDLLPVILEVAAELCQVPNLQRLWKLLVENPGWTVAHIIVHFDYHHCLEHGLVRPALTACDPTTCHTPLHVAIRNNNTRIIQTIFALGAIAFFDVVDGQGNNIFHFAAQASKDVIEVLAKVSTKGINDFNKDGHTPLHLACIHDKTDCVHQLLIAGADVNATGISSDGIASSAVSGARSAREILSMFPKQLHSEDMKTGGTPLHWSKSKEVVGALIELGCLIDARNFKGATALHVMVLRDRLPCIIYLLCHGASVNLVDENGNTPLHIAATRGVLPIIQALLVFGADPNTYNNNGESARHLIARGKLANRSLLLYTLHAVGARRCLDLSSTCAAGCAPAGNDDGIPPETASHLRSRHALDDFLSSLAGNLTNRRTQPPFDSTLASSAIQPARKGLRVLSLDGGGIRGLILIQMLKYLEEATKVPIIHCFDWIAGTSTGGVLALALATGKSVRECQCLYFRLKDKVFVGTRPYDSENLEAFLRQEIGEAVHMSDISHPKLAIMGLLADRFPPDLHIFRNYTAPQDMLSLPDESVFPKPDPPSGQLAWRAARASGAAPTYFRSFGRFLDGGLVANNPTLDVLTEIHEYNAILTAMGLEDEVAKPSVVLSLGCGNPPVQKVGTIDIYRPGSLTDTLRLAAGASAFGNLLVEQATAADGRVVDRSRAWCHMIGATYVRLSPPLTECFTLDETNDEVLVRALWETQTYVHQRREEIRKLASVLVRD